LFVKLQIFRNTILIYASQEGKEVLAHLSPLTYCNTISFSGPTLQGMLAELFVILDSFYTCASNIISDHIDVEVVGAIKW